MSPDQHRADDAWVHPAACDRRHAEIDERLTTIAEMLQSLDNRLYRDNGHRSIQSTLRDHDRVICVVLWACGIVGTGLIGGILTGVWCLLKYMVKAGC